MITTRHNITININDEEFNVVIVEPSKTLKEMISKRLEQHNNLLDELNKKLSEREFVGETMNINKGLLQEGNFLDKANTWLEQRKLLGDLRKLDIDIEDVSQKLKDLDGILEEVFKEKLQEIIENGSERAQLFTVMNKYGISFQRLNDEIMEQLKAKKKGA